MEIDLSDEEFVLPEQHVKFALTLPEPETRQTTSVLELASDEGELLVFEVTRYPLPCFRH